MISVALKRSCPAEVVIDGERLDGSHAPEWKLIRDWVGLFSQYHLTVNCSVGRVATVKLICFDRWFG
jgi:hypothetical protein